MNKTRGRRGRTRRLLATMGSLAAALLLLGVFSAGAQAAPGDLDVTFSGDGKQTTAFGGSDGANGVALQPNGKTVAVGFALTGTGGGRFALARYNPNGSLDTSFSADGRVFTNFRGSGEGANGVAIQPNGKIVVVGVATGDDDDDFALARYNPNGSLDPSFSGDGKQRTQFANGGEARGMALQPNGKIVAVGGSGAGPNGAGDYALARYNPNGSLDTSFSGDGKQTTDFGRIRPGQAHGVALQGDRKIVAVGDGPDRFSNSFTLARYNPNGSLDTSFSGNGKQLTNFGDSTSDGARGVALQGDGKIVAVGYAGFEGGAFALARYNPDGSLDTSFSGDGMETTEFPFGGVANGLALQGDGKIVAVGGAFSSTFGGDFALARYNPNGSLDTSFSGDGTQTTEFGEGAGANGVALTAHGKIVTVGVGRGPNQTNDFALARYLGG
jgi:uncharacterized delta-60 repeat protein